jgi:hypothetical protein
MQIYSCVNCGQVNAKGYYSKVEINIDGAIEEKKKKKKKK